MPLAPYHLGNLIGNPYETAIAVASVVFGGILERLADDVLGGGYGIFARATTAATSARRAGSAAGRCRAS